MRLLLDTHVLVWWVNDSRRLNAKQRRALSKASPNAPLHVSDITLWEVAGLTERSRIRLSLPVRDWLDAATAPPLVLRLPISPAVAAELTGLPLTLDWDPADRIIVATARVHALKLVTADQRIIGSGLVDVL
ncbi:MAG: type II toxin-antitoxin system VapC family toxin [Myxococcales bacterium]|nr:type II toxin-antitoxin system VapC family toxin [Myxococcales bacterium]